jgi:Ribbon-helix-helix protein, copG family
MNALRRTTVAAPQETFRTLEAEADRWGVSLTAILREAVDEKADAIRQAHRPHVAIAQSTDERAARDLTAEPIAEPPR